MSAAVPCVVCGEGVSQDHMTTFKCGYCHKPIHDHCDLEARMRAANPEDVINLFADIAQGFFCSQQCCDASATVRCLS